jgi:hypothetical protein
MIYFEQWLQKITGSLKVSCMLIQWQPPYKLQMSLIIIFFEDGHLLGWCTVLSGRYWLTLTVTITGVLLITPMMEAVSLKHQAKSTRQHSAPSQENSHLHIQHSEKLKSHSLPSLNTLCANPNPYTFLQTKYIFCFPLKKQRILYYTDGTCWCYVVSISLPKLSYFIKILMSL